MDKKLSHHASQTTIKQIIPVTTGFVHMKRATFRNDTNSCCIDIKDLNPLCRVRVKLHEAREPRNM